MDVELNQDEDAALVQHLAARGVELAKLEGIIPALESAHAFSALNQMKFKPTDNVIVCLSGRGDKDLKTYMDVMEGK